MYNWLKYVLSSIMLSMRLTPFKVTPAKGFEILDEVNLKAVIEAM
jgi:hypothetical protein